MLDQGGKVKDILTILDFVYPFPLYRISRIVVTYISISQQLSGERSNSPGRFDTILWEKWKVNNVIEMMAGLKFFSTGIEGRY